jgi:superoxide dismutase, Fe-Mn family
MQLAKRKEVKQYELPDLPYPLDALQPYVSRETLEFHWGKHHRGYVDKLNELIRGTELEGLSLDEVVTRSEGALFNNAAQSWNHEFYWHCMKPRGGGKPGGELALAIDRKFGSFAAFEKEFKKDAIAKFGSGWTWLVRKRDGALVVENTDDADNPMVRGDTPLLTCDVWEHAYYIDYRNERAKYVDAFWNLVNWDFVAKNLPR